MLKVNIKHQKRKGLLLTTQSVGSAVATDPMNFESSLTFSGMNVRSLIYTCAYIIAAMTVGTAFLVDFELRMIAYATIIGAILMLYLLAIGYSPVQTRWSYILLTPIALAAIKFLVLIDENSSHFIFHHSIRSYPQSLTSSIIDLAMIASITVFIVSISLRGEVRSQLRGLSADCLMLVVGITVFCSLIANAFRNSTAISLSEVMLIIAVFLACWSFIVSIVFSIFSETKNWRNARQIASSFALLCSAVFRVAPAFNIPMLDIDLCYRLAELSLNFAAAIFAMDLYHNPIGHRIRSRGRNKLLSKLRVSSIALPALAPLAGWLVAAQINDMPQLETVLLASSICATTLAARVYGLLIFSYQQQSRLAQLANIDGLTGVLNHRGFVNFMRNNKDKSGITAFIDLNDFKSVNDHYGHHLGDQVLCWVANQLQTIAPNIHVARLGGDEFAIALEEGVLTSEGLKQRINGMLSTWFHADGEKILISASIGVTDPAPFDQGALRRGDMAMYAEKKRRRGNNSKTSQEKPSTHDKQHLRQHINEQLVGKLPIYCQPIIDRRQSRILGVEILARMRSMNDPSVLMPPSEFLPLMDEDGLHMALTEAVIRSLPEAEAFSSCSYISLNISAKVFSSIANAQRIHELLNELNYRPSRVVFEITDNSSDQDIVPGSSMGLAAMSKLGYQLAIENYGAGYSCVSRLANLSAHSVKIDRELMVAATNGNEAPLESSIALAYRLGAEPIVEGIETTLEMQTAIRLGANCMQGFLITPPKPLLETIRYINLRNKGIPKLNTPIYEFQANTNS